MTERQARRTAILGIGIWLGLHVFWIFRSEINWDEYALLARAHDSLLQGRLIGGGRPGLSTLLLMPVVRGCANTVTAALQARLLWTPFIAAIPMGLWLLLAELFQDRDTRWRDGLWGMALIALTPAFMHYSLQVRTDQPAIALGLLGGLALLGSRRRPILAGLAGLLFALGFSSSQKLAYVAALVGMLAVAESLVADRFRPRRDLGRIALVIATGLLTLVAYRYVVSLFIRPAPPMDVGGQMSWFAWYREHVGFGYYLLMLPGLLVPLGLTLLVTLRAPVELLRRGAAAGAAATALAVVGVGLLVAGFHAGALPYFWMTLGLFPAVAVAVGMPFVRQWMDARARRLVFLVSVGVLLGTAVNAGIEESAPGLVVQRHAMALVDANFPAFREGFSTKRALFCRDGEEPFPAYFGPILHDWDQTRIDAFIDEFRERPITFMIKSRDMEVFPDAIQTFWAGHYVDYSGSVMVPGMNVGGVAGDTLALDVIVPGVYTLHGADFDTAITIDGELMRARGTRTLAKGTHEITGVRGDALLALDLATPPGSIADRFWVGH